MNEKEREILTCIAEEAGEVVQACTKALRHGLQSYHPDHPDTNNADDVYKEVCDLVAVSTMATSILKENCTSFGEIDFIALQLKKLNYMHHFTAKDLVAVIGEQNEQAS